MSHDAKTILVTGGAGFIGSAVVRYLMDATQHRVINVDKLSYASNESSISAVCDDPRYTFYKTDICDSDAMTDIFKKHAPDIVMNLAAETHVDKSLDMPDDFVHSNIIGTYRLLRCAHAYWSGLQGQRADGFKFHQISTDEVFGDLDPDEPAFTEDSPYHPSSPYSASKASADHLARAWHRSYGLPVVISNTSNNYGMYQFPEKLIPLTITNALQGKSLPIYGDGKQVRDWLYVKDHAKALMIVATQGICGETYNISANQEMHNIDVVMAICDLLQELAPASAPNSGQGYASLIEFVTDRPGHDVRYALNAEKIKNKLGWEAEFDFVSGLRETVEWYVNHHDWCQQMIQQGQRRPSFL